MRLLRISIRFLFVYLLFAAVSIGAFGQQSFTKKIKTAGWSVPKTEGLQILEKTEVDLGGFRVLRIDFKLTKPRPFVTLENGNKCELNSLSTYTARGETFGVGYDCIMFGHDPRYGKFYFGGIGNMSFVDDDGDGKFETRVSSGISMMYVPARLQTEKNRFWPTPPPLPTKISSLK